MSGTRADFGKLKSLIRITQNASNFESHIFVTGMHLQKKYGYTVNEIEKSGFKNIYTFENHTTESTMDLTLSKTIEGLSSYIKSLQPDLIVVHGDRVEALAGAIVGSLNNILVGHIEGGELSGTIDELIRHSVSKMSHIHFVSNNEAKSRLIQMGELEDHIYIIGSPDLDIMFSSELPSINTVKEYYNIPFKNYSLVMMHPVTTELNQVEYQSKNLVNALLKTKENFVLIYPNNDMGSSKIIQVYEQLKDQPNFKVFPSLRFEYFLVLLKNCQYMIGNSSAGVRETPYYNIASVNIGTRQQNRAKNDSIINCGYSEAEILAAIKKTKSPITTKNKTSFGMGNSDELFYSILNTESIWNIPCQKQFNDL